YERCQPRHSWYINHVVTNLFLYQLQRHSDHHANPTRRYQALRHFEDSPQLPSGYAAMILIAYLPPLWFRVMDPKVVKHHGGDLSKANLYAPRRAELMARWAAAAPKAVAGTSAATMVREVSPQIAVNASTRFQCTNCNYIYDPKLGSPHQGFAAGTLWADLPKDWCCPDCSVREKPDFKPLVD
ncbi:MAG: alkane 1-monooxygenase, partial [Rhizobium sp.]